MPSRRTTALPIRRDRFGQVDLVLGPVELLGLEEHHRVRGGDGHAQQAVGIGGGGRRDDVQAGRVCVVGLGGVAVVLDSADAAGVRDPDHHGQATGPLVRLRILATWLMTCSKAG